MKMFLEEGLSQIYYGFDSPASLETSFISISKLGKQDRIAGLRLNGGYSSGSSSSVSNGYGSTSGDSDEQKEKEDENSKICVGCGLTSAADGVAQAGTVISLTNFPPYSQWVAAACWGVSTGLKTAGDYTHSCTYESSCAQ